MCRTKHENKCEICKVLKDLLEELTPEKYQSGPNFIIGNAILAALVAHLNRIRS